MKNKSIEELDIKNVLKNALKENDFIVPNDFDEIDCYEKQIKVKGKWKMDFSSLNLVLQHTEKLISDNIENSTQKDLLMDICLSYHFLLSTSMWKETLSDSAMKFRIFFDNVRRYYKFVNKNIHFSTSLMKLLNVCGAECHLGGIFSENSSDEFTKTKNLFWFTAFANSFGEIVKILADIIVKISKINKSINLLAVFGAIETSTNISISSLRRIYNGIQKV